MALEAASEAVKTPNRIPPMMMTGTISAGIASISALRNSDQVKGLPPLQSFLRESQMAMQMSAALRSTAGTMPAIKSLPTDVLVVVP